MKTPFTIQRLLDQRYENGRFRKLNAPQSGFIDFYSNDYLGLAGNKIVQKEFLKSLTENDNEYLFGSTGSRLVSGNVPVFDYAENYLADFFMSESSLLFSSGFQANLAFFSSVPQKCDLVVYDSEIHASIKTSLRQSNAALKSFIHNDIEDLQKKISHNGGAVYVVVESMYSISGDVAPLLDLTGFCEQNNCLLVVDEAHTTGLYGKEGRGLCCELEIEERVFARIHTFGKALGVAGGLIACSNDLREYLINFSIPFIYSTAMPPVQVKSILFYLNFLRRNNGIHEKLNLNIEKFRQEALMSGVADKFSNFNHILNLKTGSDKLALTLSEYLTTEGFLLKAMLPPTTREGNSSIRIVMHAYNSEEEIDKFFLHIKKLY